MAEEIGKQTRQTPSDGEVQAANDGHQERRVDVDSRSDVVTKPHHMPGAQEEDTTGDAVRNDQRQDGVSVQMSGTVADHSHDNLGLPVNAPVPFEERDGKQA